MNPHHDEARPTVTRGVSSAHGHGWLVGLAGLGMAFVLLAVLPGMPTIAGIVLLVVLFHIVGVAMLAGSIYTVFSRPIGRLVGRWRLRHARPGRIDFGWSPGAIWGPWLAAAALLCIAVGLQMELPRWWPLWSVIGLQAVACFIGGLIMRQGMRPEVATLPLVRVLGGDADRILDAGCGGGRTTLAIAKVMGSGRIVALDRFDAYYIDGGGRELLRRNLGIAGLADRVEIVPGDLTSLPFPDRHFDSIVSTHAVDHLGSGTRAGLAELHRTLRPGGRMLLVLWVPGWTTFAIASLTCLGLATPTVWERRLRAAGFAVVEAGHLNGMWFILVERPAHDLANAFSSPALAMTAPVA